MNECSHGENQTAKHAHWHLVDGPCNRVNVALLESESEYRENHLRLVPPSHQRAGRCYFQGKLRVTAGVD